MTKPVACLLLALGLAACAPKAIVVDEPAPPATGTGRKPVKTGSAPADTQATPPAIVNQDSGMRTPNLTNKLPDRKDMTATAPTTPGGGVIATPPTADKGKE